jgi:hypothetical protein
MKEKVELNDEAELASAGHKLAVRPLDQGTKSGPIVGRTGVSSHSAAVEALT